MASDNNKKIALVVGGTGMAANGILPHLLNEKGSEYVLSCFGCLL
jgi:hypothetical protein